MDINTRKEKKKKKKIKLGKEIYIGWSGEKGRNNCMRSGRRRINYDKEHHHGSFNIKTNVISCLICLNEYFLNMY
jgi:hypothetical protein